jgi:hypothetical protein
MGTIFNKLNNHLLFLALTFILKFLERYCKINTLSHVNNKTFFGMFQELILFGQIGIISSAVINIVTCTADF